MTIKEFLKKLGLDLDADVKDDEDTENKSNAVVKDEGGKKDNGDKSSPPTLGEYSNINNSQDNTVEKTDNKPKEEHSMVPKYNTKTGLFDLAGIEDAELKAVLKLANDTVKTNNNKAVIDKAIDNKISTLKLTKGISNNLIKKSLDVTNIKVNDDGQVTGVDEAFDALKKSEAGLFVAENENKQGSNPLLEGFNPVQGVGENNTFNSFAEAFSAMQDN